MKVTKHLSDQIDHCKNEGIDLTELELTGEESNLYLTNKSGDPVPPGNPPPVPPVHN